MFVRCVGSDHSDRPNCKLHTLKTPEAAQYMHMCMCVCQLAVSRESPCFYITQRYSVFVMFYSVSILSVYGFVLGFSSFFSYMGCNSFPVTLVLSFTPFFRHFHDFASHANVCCSCSRCITDTPTPLTSEQKMFSTRVHTHTYTPTVTYTLPHVGEVAHTHIHKHTLPLIPTYPLASLPWPH